MSNSISINNLNKKFKGVELYDNLNLEIEGGKITSLFGPNGAGKSTLLNIIAGITCPDSGSCVIKDFKPLELSYIFQNYRESLLPWKTNFDNVALPLKLRGERDDVIKKRVKELQEIFDFDCHWRGYPYQLSGGQQQILAFLRALITKPKLLFIDEPFSALDYENNLRLRKSLQTYYLTYKPTIILITHNIEEAVHVSDKIVVLSNKPTTIAATINNQLPFPRNIETFKSAEFKQIRDQTLDAFQKITRS